MDNAVAERNSPMSESFASWYVSNCAMKTNTTKEIIHIVHLTTTRALSECRCQGAETVYSIKPKINSLFFVFDYSETAARCRFFRFQTCFEELPNQVGERYSSNKSQPAVQSPRRQ